MSEKIARIPTSLLIVLIISIHIMRALLIMILAPLPLMNHELLFGPTGIDPLYIGQIYYGIFDVFAAALLLTKRHLARYLSSLMAILVLSFTIWVFVTNTISAFYFPIFLLQLVTMALFAMIEIAVLTSETIRSNFK